MNYYRRHVGDYAKKAGHLSVLEHGVYTLLMDAYYDREQPPTKAEAIRQSKARTPEILQALDAVLSDFFILTNGVYVQPRIEEEFEKAAEYARIQRENGKKGGRPRKPRRKPNESDGLLRDNPNESQKNLNESQSTNPLIHKEDSMPDGIGGPPVGDPPESRHEAIPMQAILGLYNATMTRLPKARELTPKRRTLIRSAWQASPKRRSVAFWENFFLECEDNDFLNGTGPYRNGHENWRPDFDYLVKAETVTRVFERAMDRMDRQASEGQA